MYKSIREYDFEHKHVWMWLMLGQVELTPAKILRLRDVSKSVSNILTPARKNLRQNARHKFSVLKIIRKKSDQISDTFSAPNF